jgi:hypothetical protein
MSVQTTIYSTPYHRTIGCGPHLSRTPPTSIQRGPETKELIIFRRLTAAAEKHFYHDSPVNNLITPFLILIIIVRVEPPLGQAQELSQVQFSLPVLEKNPPTSAFWFNDKAR